VGFDAREGLRKAGGYVMKIAQVRGLTDIVTTKVSPSVAKLAMAPLNEEHIRENQGTKRVADIPIIPKRGI
jgi:hypothetical protein